jgi:hypothetical protein
MSIVGVDLVIGNLFGIFERKKAALYALCLYYAAKVLEIFNRRQAADEFWQNRTYQAKDRVHSDAFQETDVVGFFIAHGVHYGKYLEFAKDGRNAALWPVVKGVIPDFMRDLKELYG